MWGGEISHTLYPPIIVFFYQNNQFGESKVETCRVRGNGKCMEFQLLVAHRPQGKGGNCLNEGLQLIFCNILRIIHTIVMQRMGASDTNNGPEIENILFTMFGGFISGACTFYGNDANCS